MHLDFICQSEDEVQEASETGVSSYSIHISCIEGLPGWNVLCLLDILTNACRKNYQKWKGLTAGRKSNQHISVSPRSICDVDTLGRHQSAVYICKEQFIAFACIQGCIAAGWHQAHCIILSMMLTKFSLVYNSSYRVITCLMISLYNCPGRVASRTLFLSKYGTKARQSGYTYPTSFSPKNSRHNRAASMTYTQGIFVRSMNS